MKKILSDKSSTVIIFLVLTVFLQVLSFKILQIVIPEVIIADYANFMTKILMVILALEFAFFFWKTPLEINFEVFKVKKECNFAREVTEAAVISAIIIVCMIVYRFYLNGVNAEVAARPAFGLYLNIHARWFYPVSVLVQELLIKAVVQHNIGTIDKKISKHFTVWVTSLFFGILHMAFPMYFLLGAVFLCALTGYMYERDKNIWGTVLIHFVVGFMPRALGLK